MIRCCAGRTNDEKYCFHLLSINVLTSIFGTLVLKTQRAVILYSQCNIMNFIWILNVEREKKSFTFVLCLVFVLLFSVSEIRFLTIFAIKKMNNNAFLIRIANFMCRK